MILMNVSSAHANWLLDREFLGIWKFLAITTNQHVRRKSLLDAFRLTLQKQSKQRNLPLVLCWLWLVCFLLSRSVNFFHQRWYQAVHKALSFVIARVAKMSWRRLKYNKQTFGSHLEKNLYRTWDFKLG